jgi:hypothetical protein
MSVPEKDYEDKLGSNGIQASSGPAYGPDAVGRGSDEEKASGGPDGTWGHINGESRPFSGGSCAHKNQRVLLMDK